MPLNDAVITIERRQLDDWFKLLLKHPEPVWSGDVTSNLALERMKQQGLARELDDGWHLTDLAVDSVRMDNIYVAPRQQQPLEPVTSVKPEHGYINQCLGSTPDNPHEFHGGIGGHCQVCGFGHK